MCAFNRFRGALGATYFGIRKAPQPQAFAAEVHPSLYEVLVSRISLETVVLAHSFIGVPSSHHSPKQLRLVQSQDTSLFDFSRKVPVYGKVIERSGGGGKTTKPLLRSSG